MTPPRTLADAIGRARLVFFVGKGGVGKTTLAAACALADAARAPARLLGTDPAETLGRVLEADLRTETAVAPGLVARQLDPEGAAGEFRREYGEVLASIIEGGTYLAAEDARRLASLSLPGIDEVLALLELADPARGPEGGRTFVDTAPSLHAQRLLALPAAFGAAVRVLDSMRAKARVVEETLSGRVAETDADRFLGRLQHGLAALRAALSEASAGLILVATPEDDSVAEATRLAGELARQGLSPLAIVLNLCDGERPCCDRGALRAWRREEAARALAERHPDVPLFRLERLAEAPVGLASLGALGKSLLAAAPAPPPSAAPRPNVRISAAPLPVVLPGSIATARLVLVGGKGGVGKTTVAAALATSRAASSAGGRVLLASVGAPGGLSRVLESPVAGSPGPVGGATNLDAIEVDALERFGALKAEFRSDVEAALDRLLGRGRNLDLAYDREIARGLLELTPPGVDEIAGLAFLADVGDDYAAVVLDTAPTGHLLRFLEMPALARSWLALVLSLLGRYPELASASALDRTLSALRRVRKIADWMADRERTALVAVALPERIPADETVRLRERATRAGVPPAVVVVNRVESASSCPDCSGRRTAHLDVVDRLAASVAPVPLYVIPESLDEPRGLPRLAGLPFLAVTARTAA